MPLMYYAHPLGPNTAKSPEGYLICQNVRIARTGSQIYSAGELGLDGDPTRPITEQRDAAEVFAPETLASFEGKPVTDGHPPMDVEPTNHASFARGHVQDVRQGTGADAGYILADLWITDPLLIADIEHKTKRQVSCGYNTDHVALPNGDFTQRNIRGNHVAVVPEGRAGSQVAIRDSQPDTPVAHIPCETSQKGRLRMRTRTNDSKLHSLLRVFARGVRDAKTGDEVDEMAEDMTDAIQGLQADCSPTTLPTGDGTVPPPNPDAQGDKALITSLLGEAMAPVLAAIAQLKSDVAALKAGEVGEKPTDDALGDAIKQLAAADSAAAGEEEVDSAANEAAVTADPEEMDEDGSLTDKAARDAAIKILTQARPAIAAIADAAERKRVTDALLAAVTPPRGLDGVRQIMGAVLSTQGKRRVDGAAAKPVSAEAMQALYNTRNPHYKSEE